MKKFFRKLRLIAVLGPGLLVALADTDVGNIVTAAQSGAQWGYRLLVLVLALIPLLYLVQELTVRLGIFTGLGLTEIVRIRYGKSWAWIAVGALSVATLGSLVTEFTGVAAVGDLYGVSRSVSLPMAAGALFAVVLSGSYRRIEKIALILGLFELAFFFVAWMAHPNLETIARQATEFPIWDRDFMFLASALIGSVFNPWMIFYQQSAVADKGLTPAHYLAEKWDTGIGAVLAQLITAAVLVALAATVDGEGLQHSIQSIEDVSESLIPMFGSPGGHLIFSVGVMGAAMVAAIVSSLALSWAISEASGYSRKEHRPGSESPWFYVGYGVFVAAGAIFVGCQANLIWLDVVVQVINTFMLPILIALLITLVQTAEPQSYRLHGFYLWTLIISSVLVCMGGVFGGLSVLVER
jgi:Mn2+/Fe2+ NRAMP family transporter